jgi:hypothetical protein
MIEIGKNNLDLETYRKVIKLFSKFDIGSKV